MSRARRMASAPLHCCGSAGVTSLASTLSAGHSRSDTVSTFGSSCCNRPSDVPRLDVYRSGGDSRSPRRRFQNINSSSSSKSEPVHYKHRAKDLLSRFIEHEDTFTESNLQSRGVQVESLWSVVRDTAARCRPPQPCCDCACTDQDAVLDVLEAQARSMLLGPTLDVAIMDLLTQVLTARQLKSDLPEIIDRLPEPPRFIRHALGPTIDEVLIQGLYAVRNLLGMDGGSGDVGSNRTVSWANEWLRNEYAALDEEEARLGPDDPSVKARRRVLDSLADMLEHKKLIAPGSARGSGRSRSKTSAGSERKRRPKRQSPCSMSKCLETYGIPEDAASTASSGQSSPRPGVSSNTPSWDSRGDYGKKSVSTSCSRSRLDKGSCGCSKTSLRFTSPTSDDDPNLAPRWPGEEGPVPTWILPRINYGSEEDLADEKEVRTESYEKEEEDKVSRDGEKQNVFVMTSAVKPISAPIPEEAKAPSSGPSSQSASWKSGKTAVHRSRRSVGVQPSPVDIAKDLSERSRQGSCSSLSSRSDISNRSKPSKRSYPTNRSIAKVNNLLSCYQADLEKDSSLKASLYGDNTPRHRSTKKSDSYCDSSLPPKTEKKFADSIDYSVSNQKEDAAKYGNSPSPRPSVSLSVEEDHLTISWTEGSMPEPKQPNLQKQQQQHWQVKPVLPSASKDSCGYEVGNPQPPDNRNAYPDRGSRPQEKTSFTSVSSRLSKRSDTKKSTSATVILKSPESVWSDGTHSPDSIKMNQMLRGKAHSENPSSNTRSPEWKSGLSVSTCMAEGDVVGGSINTGSSSSQRAPPLPAPNVCSHELKTDSPPATTLKRRSRRPSARPEQILWSVTKINVFPDRSRTYEVLSPSFEKPPRANGQPHIVFATAPPL